MKRSLFFSLIAALATHIGLGADKPNVLFILVDDFGQRDLGIYGSSVYETPHMDALAKSGARFNQAYVAYPRCVPSRFGIMTGKHPAGFQKDRDSVHVEPDRDRTFGQPFKENGYATFYCGKWHLGDGPEGVGFITTVAAGAAGATRSQFAPYDVAKSGKGEKEAVPDLNDAPEGEYLTDRLTEETMDFIKENKDNPFMAVLAHYAVHTPIEAKKHLTKRYQAKIDGMTIPEVLYEKESAGENLLVQNNAEYAAMIESVDKGVGRLMKLLERLEIDENTIVVLASDHGGLSARGGKREVATSNRPLRAGKGHLYEGGLRIPLFVRWPGHTKPDTVIVEPVVTMDLYPSFLEMAGLPLEPEAHQDGLSFVSLLADEAPAGARAAFEKRLFYWHNPSPRPSSTADLFSSAIREGNLKLVEFPEEKRVELYDLSSDIEESKNLASVKKEDADRLLHKLRKWRESHELPDKPRIRRKEKDAK